MDTQKSNSPFWRQGDIYFVKLDGEPRAPESRSVKSGIIAKGETTGHAHRLSQSSMTEGASLFLVGSSMFLRSPETGAKIVHDEHHVIDLPAGLFAVVPQQEFDGMDWRQVLD